MLDRMRPINVAPFLANSQKRPYDIQKIIFDVITISGPSGTLKSSVAKELAALFDVSLHRRGGDLRNTLREKSSKEIVGRIAREDVNDTSLDAQTQSEIIQAHASGMPCIIEGRLAGLILSNMRVTHILTPSPLRALTIVIHSNDDAKREHRIYKRQQKKETIASSDVASQTAERQREDTRRWQQQYGALLGGHDPFSATLVNKAGDLVYDLPLLIDHQPDSLHIPSDATRQAMVAEIIQELRQRGLISPNHTKNVEAS